MRSNDLNRDNIRAAMQAALANNDTEDFARQFDQMLECIGQEVRAECEGDMAALRQDLDNRVLTARGVRQLTQKETAYYQRVIDAMKSGDPRQALNGLDVVMPETVFDSVFEDLRTNHPLLSRINFVPTGAAARMMLNTNGYQEAAWGPLCGEIVSELTSGFKEVDTSLLKLTAFIPVCRAMLDLGPQWLDRYVREILYEALANGMESGIATGDGNEKPIGMNRQVGDDVSVQGGKYPEKAKIAVTEFSTSVVGELIGKLATSEKGNPRPVRGVVLLVNPSDYYTKVMPATTLMAPDGSYRNDVMPYPMDILQVASIPEGSAIIGMAGRYFAAAGTAKTGKIEYSDHYHFLEDERVYTVRAYANGMPMDNNSFLYLDITGLTPAVYPVQVVGTTEASGN